MLNQPAGCHGQQAYYKRNFLEDQVSSLNSIHLSQMDELAHRVQALPAELFNAVLEKFFEFEIPECLVTQDYRPPVQLQINRYWRRTYADSYYGRHIFWACSQHIYLKWRTSLSPENQAIYNGTVRMLSRFSY